LKATFDLETAEVRALQVQRDANGGRRWNDGAAPHWSTNNTTAMPGGGTVEGVNFQVNGALLFLRDSLLKMERDVAAIDALPVTAAKMNKAFHEEQFVPVVDNAERNVAFTTQAAMERLWNMYLFEAAWEYHLLSQAVAAKVWNFQKSYAGDVNAAEDEYRAAVEILSNTGCKASTWGEGHICQDRWSEVESEYARRTGGVCERSSKQVAPIVAETAARLQAIAQRLKETHARIAGDFRRVVEKIELTKGGAKADIFARADQYLKEASVLVTSGSFVNFEPTNFAVYLLVPYARDGQGPRPCVNWREQMPEDLGRLFPAVTIMFDPTDVRFSLALNQARIVEGEADARRATARP
jgi:hypothetical protein